MDITKLTLEELWKLAFEQQEALTNLLAQIQQAQSNINILKAEIEKRKNAPNEKPLLKEKEA